MSRKHCGPCHKGVYECEEDAIREILYRVQYSSKPLGWYRCPENDKWLHLTSKNGTRKPPNQ